MPQHFAGENMLEESVKKKHFIDHFWQKVALNTCISQLFFDVLPTKQMQRNAYRAPQYPILISYSEGAKYFGGGRCGCYTEFGLNSKYLIAILWISFSVEEFQVFFVQKALATGATADPST